MFFDIDYKRSKLQSVALPDLENKDLKIMMKRDDLLHPVVSGNKLRKLQALYQAKDLSRYAGILSMGGAFSNYLPALAFVGNVLGILTVGLVRGEAVQGNPILDYCQSQNMQLKFVDREVYRKLRSGDVPKQITDAFPKYLWVPEGGSITYMRHGFLELWETIPDNAIIAVGAGSGGTARGLLQSMPFGSKLRAYSAAKNDHELKGKIEHDNEFAQFTMVEQYHFGGYAKVTKELLEFIDRFYQKNGVLLDPVYTAKVAYGIQEDLRAGAFMSNRPIVILHTGGLSGWIGIDLMRKWDLTDYSFFKEIRKIKSQFN